MKSRVKEKHRACCSTEEYTQTVNTAAAPVAFGAVLIMAQVQPQ